jgi:hypothetical protein
MSVLAIRMSDYIGVIAEFVDSPVTLTLHGTEPFHLGIKPTNVTNVFRIHTDKDASGACAKRVREHMLLILDMIPFTKAESVSFKSPLFPTIHVPIQEWEKGVRLIEDALKLYGF